MGMFSPHMLCCDGNSCSSESAHRLAIDKMYNDIVDALVDCGDCMYNECKPSYTTQVQGWIELCKTNHEEARSAFLQWRYNGKPRFGPIFDLLQRTRANFKSTLRKCISGNDNRTADSLATKFLNKDFKRFVVILENIMSRTLQYLVL